MTTGNDKEKKDNELTIKVETGGEKKESSSQGGQQAQAPVQAVKRDPLGYAEERAAAVSGAPVGAPAVNLMNPVAPGNHPQVDLMNPVPAENRAVAASREALGRQIAAPLPQKDPYQEGYDAQQGLDGIAELLKEREEMLKGENEKLGTMVEEDETMRRNERSRKVIAGLGDAISSVVNLVGTMNGAYDQKQVFMEPRLRDVVEQDRQRRYARIERQRANVQNQINAINSLKMAGAKQAASERQAAAALAYKAANDAANRAQKQGEYDRNYDLKVQQYTDEAARKDAEQKTKEAVAKSQISRNYASGQAATTRANAYAEHQGALAEKARSGGGNGRGSGSTKEYMYYDEFRDELVKGRGYSSWEDAVKSPKPEDRMLINSLKNATSPNDQQGVIDTYYTRTPNWTQKYRGVTQQAPEQKPAEDDNTPPSMRAAQQQAADDDNTPPSRRNRR
ncbi:MAG: hypothetical protein IK084_03030 [Bacteroidaceae bacterium]|nr:hypothetical protein [Bacteroidaceae bacterium]